MLVPVKNLRGTSDNFPRGYDSWADFWERKTGRPWPVKCAAYGCAHTADVGGHVKKVGGMDNKWYIVPICSLHNSPFNGDIYYVDDRDLVPVN